MMLCKPVLMSLYQRLYEAYGPQHWWPGDTPFEVMVGAVLTQNTAWINVERAIGNLKQADKLQLPAMQRMTETRLAQLIRPAGYFNVKARRLKHLCHWLTDNGGIRRLSRRPTPVLREALLAVHGVGPETADDILLYAFQRPVFVIDAYTRRLLQAHQLIHGNEPYELLRAQMQAALDADVPLYNEYHALFVRHAKERCQGDADCLHCRVESPLSLKVIVES
jgi:endonuclease-3 related protein